MMAFGRVDAHTMSPGRRPRPAGAAGLRGDGQAGISPTPAVGHAARRAGQQGVAEFRGRCRAAAGMSERDNRVFEGQPADHEEAERLGSSPGRAGSRRLEPGVSSGRPVGRETDAWSTAAICTRTGWLRVDQ